MLGADMSKRLLLTHIVLMTVLQMLAIWNVFDARTAPARYLSAAMVALLTAAVIWRVIQLRQRLRAIR
jgi:hypothetical protein